MPQRSVDRNAFVARIAWRAKLARRFAQVRRRLMRPRVTMQAEVYDRTFRSDREAVSYYYALRNDHLPDLDNPVWLNEKIRWQFLNHPNPLMSLAADKIAVRDYLRLKGASIEAPQLLATGCDPAEIAAVDLPERFVLKSSFGSGQMAIETGDFPAAPAALIEKARRWTRNERWRRTGEMHYRGVPQRWLVEEFVPARVRKLEFKVFCMQGEPAFIAVITERKPVLRHALFDPDWRRAGFETIGIETDPREVPRPAELDLILSEARRLSEDFMHVRVDFLVFDDRIVFSELTFASLAARVPHTPSEANVHLGALMDLAQAPDLLARGRQIAAGLGWGAAEATMAAPDRDTRVPARVEA